MRTQDTMSHEDKAEDTKSLAAIGFDIVRLFDSLWSSPIGDCKGHDRDDLAEQQQRFDLWATNIGLHQRGHASLDYRFRDASEINQYCRNLLEDLAKALEICK